MFNSILEAGSRNGEVRRLANGRNGVIQIHRELANNGPRAKALAEAVYNEAQAQGISIDEAYQQNISNFAAGTLAPSLQLDGVAGDRTISGRELLTVTSQGGKVKFEIKPLPNYSSGRQPQFDRFRSSYNRFVANVQKAEADLNIILRSYQNMTGASGSALADAAVQSFVDAYGIEVEGGEL